jgi:membrane protein
MADPAQIGTRRPGGSGWSLAAAIGLMAAAFLWDRIAPLDRVAHRERDKAFPETGEADRHASPAELATEGGNRGRQASSPAEIPARGWKDILWRVYGNIGEHRVLALAAGMTYYSLLAIFPAIAALVAIYGLFSDASSIAKHLDDVSGFIPGGAVEVARDQLTRVATKGDRPLASLSRSGLQSRSGARMPA